MNFSLGGTLVPKLNFLDPARQFTAPEICEIVVRFTGTVGAITGGAKGRDAAKLFARWNLRDTDDIINASGSSIRLLEQAELGNKQVDPGDLTSGTTNATYNYHGRFLFEPVKAQRERDYRLPLSNLLEGGQFSLQCAAAVPTGWAAVQNDWQVVVYVRVKDGRVRETKSRRKVWEQQITQQEYFYPINGSLRGAYITSALTTAGYTDLSAFTTIYSQTLDTIPSLDTDMLLDYYRRFSDSIGSNDEFALSTPGAIALVVPARWQKLGEMIDMTTLHINLNRAAPASGVLLTDTVIDRNPTAAALQMGYPSADAYANAVVTKGMVVTDNGSKSAKGFVGKLARRLPIRIG